MHKSNFLMSFSPSVNTSLVRRHVLCRPGAGPKRALRGPYLFYVRYSRIPLAVSL